MAPTDPSLCTVVFFSIIIADMMIEEDEKGIEKGTRSTKPSPRPSPNGRGRQTASLLQHDVFLSALTLAWHP